MHKVIEKNTDFEVRSLDFPAQVPSEQKWYHNIKYLIAGLIFGVILIKSEVISWFRIQEMFHFQSFHMYGIIGSAVVVGMLSVQLIRRFKVKTLKKEEIDICPKSFSKGQIFGGLIFGFGWALTGACPGPMFALIGSGFTVVLVMFLSAVAGTWVYGYFRNKLPH